MTAQVKWQVNKSHIVDLPPPRSPVGGIHEGLGIPGSPDPKNGSCHNPGGDWYWVTPPKKVLQAHLLVLVILIYW